MLSRRGITDIRYRTGRHSDIGDPRPQGCQMRQMHPRRPALPPLARRGSVSRGGRDETGCLRRRRPDPGRRPRMRAEHDNVPVAMATEWENKGKVPIPEVLEAGWVILKNVLSRAPQLVRDRRYHQRTYRTCMVGTEMVDWLLDAAHSTVLSRHLAAAMWQVLLEEGIIQHVTREHPFRDKYLLYRWVIGDSVGEGNWGEEAFRESLALLARLAPDALFRVALRKPREDRTEEDLELIYEKLLQVPALSHLSTSVKRQLAEVLLFEAHPRPGTVQRNETTYGPVLSVRVSVCHTLIVRR
ncbi:unnamed protein product [Darwinula stevensoni]|uniref:DEP domain-containing protein n=1 Tax=Darwinula stevensoni TaxID=69355 RepID=A0A7R9AHS1_9CRUS|nr:unnamed protein product [Darwinula stevensoni]CAG0905950.1 unnamed protein product [Darwinula stevensoni]